MPAPPDLRTRTLDLEAHATLCGRQWAKKRDVAEQSFRRRRGLPGVPDEEKRLLAWVNCRSLTTAEIDARRLRRKNAKALRLAIEQSEREALEKAKEAARLAKLRRQQDRAVQRLKGLVIVSSSSSDESDDPPPAADGYNYAGDQKGKGPARKW